MSKPTIGETFGQYFARCGIDYQPAAPGLLDRVIADDKGKMAASMLAVILKSKT